MERLKYLTVRDGLPSQTCLWVSRSLPQRRGSTVVCHGVRSTKHNSLSSCSGLPEVLLKEVPVTPTILWPQAKWRGGNTALPINRKLGQRFTEYGPAHQSKTLTPPRPVPPMGKVSQASYTYPSEGRQNENHNHRKLTNLITWMTALSYSMKLWAISCRATQDGRVMVESSDKMWSPGKGNGKPLQ